jgi:hypothetical protein
MAKVDEQYIEHRHRLFVTDGPNGSERWYASCSCGEVVRLGPFDTEGEARRRLSEHGADGQFSYKL